MTELETVEAKACEMEAVARWGAENGMESKAAWTAAAEAWEKAREAKART